MCVYDSFPATDAGGVMPTRLSAHPTAPSGAAPGEVQP
jgi:hypothetical protein